MTNLNIQESDFDNNYLRWKGWLSNNFGKYTRMQEIYFDTEIGRAGLDLREKIRVLEIGFGNGAFLEYARQNGWEVSGTEISPELVEAAKHRQFTVYRTDTLNEFDSNYFDLVVAFDVLEHVDQAKIPAFLSEVGRVLKSNGLLVARFPNGDSPFGLANQNGDVTHVTIIGSEKARYFSRKMGAKIVFLGGEAQPIISGSLTRTLHRLVAVPTKMILDKLINLFFYPRSNIAFCSPNLVLIVRIDKPTTESEVSTVRL